jgi:NADH-quinone oxidoreductase subunit D
MNHNFIRVGGTAADLPDGWQDRLTAYLDKIPSGSRSTRSS